MTIEVGMLSCFELPLEIPAYVLVLEVASIICKWNTFFFKDYQKHFVCCLKTCILAYLLTNSSLKVSAFPLSKFLIYFHILKVDIVCTENQ